MVIFGFRIVLLVCVACESYAQEDAEGRPAPARGLLKRNLLPRGKQTTTTTTPAPQVKICFHYFPNFNVHYVFGL